MRDKLIVSARRADFMAGRGIEIFAGHRVGESGCYAIAKSVEFEIRESGYCAPPMLVLDPDAAQQLMDELWNCGVRPTEGTGSAGSLAAMQAHLLDMREIAFNRLGVKKP